MTVKSRSSRTLAALERPAPDIPVTTNTCGRESNGALVVRVNCTFQEASHLGNQTNVGLKAVRCSCSWMLRVGQREISVSQESQGGQIPVPKREAPQWPGRKEFFVSCSPSEI